MSDKDKKEKKKRGPARIERRFIAQSSYNPWLVRVLGAVGATSLGAGTWGYVYGHVFESDEKLKPIPSYFIAGGAVLTGLTIWLGTSSETPLRVGAPGIAMERGEVRRMPWWGVSNITFESGNLALVISGKDESGSSWTFKVPVKSHAEAVGWIVKEARERIPKVVDIRDDVVDKLPAANPHAGTILELEPLQVVGKRDAITNKQISYEPDARVCPRCERVYFKRSVPKRCKCGMSLVEMRNAVAQEPDEEEDDEEEDDEDDGASSDEASTDEASTEDEELEEASGRK
jgi:hypothetical protein